MNKIDWSFLLASILAFTGPSEVSADKLGQTTPVPERIREIANAGAQGSDKGRRDFAELQIRWSPERNDYTFEDGSQLPKRAATRRTSPIFLRVDEMVFHEGWKRAGEITVRENGEYRWETRDIWNADPEQTALYTGTLPSRILPGLKQALETDDRFLELDGISKYAIGIDDHRTKHPVAIKSLREYLFQSHSSRRSPDMKRRGAKE